MKYNISMVEVLTILALAIANTMIESYWLSLLIPVVCFCIGWLKMTYIEVYYTEEDENERTDRDA